MSHLSTPRSGLSKHEVVSNLEENNDSLLDESNSFDLKNQIYELTSRYNNLEYEKNKMLMSYENVLKEQKQKYAILERLCSEKQDREEKANHTITELRAQCAYLAEENESLKKELHSLFEKNRITPDFNTLEMANEMHMLGDLIDKEERVQKLDRQLQDAKENEYAEMRERVAALEKDNRRLKDENARTEAERADAARAAAREAEEQHRALVRYKDAAIHRLEEEHALLAQQLDQARQATQRQSHKNDDHTQLRKKEERIAELEEKITAIERERDRAHSETSGLQEDNRRLESERRLLERSKKSLQEEIFRITNEISEVRAAAFNDKIECKKQVNSIKLEMEEEKSKWRAALEEKAQENKRLREGILTLNDDNQDLRDRNAAQLAQIDKLNADNHSLTQQNERYLREGNKWEHFAAESSKAENSRQHEERVANLERELNAYKAKARETLNQMNEAKAELQRSNSELESRQELVEILKIEKLQSDSKAKEAARKLSESEQSRKEKEKVIFNLEAEIRTLKDDNRQLEIANDEIKERLETMRTINSDIDNIKHQLQLEKQYYQEMRKEEEELRRKHKRSEDFKDNSKDVKSSQPPLSLEHSLKSLEQSREREAETNRQMDQLRTQNYNLQVRINEAENELSKKDIDINIKEEEISKLKLQLNSPRDLNFEPIIETSKKTQFNAVFLENKILLLEKEILGIKTLKDKEYEEYKKVYRKKIEEKYVAQVGRSNLYIAELEKNVDLLSSKLQREEETAKETAQQMEQLNKLNYEIKYDYSQALEELNALLQRYKELEGRQKELEFDHSQLRKLAEENKRLKGYVDKLTKNTDEKSFRLSNANEQIERLNQTLMVKQSELKMFKLNSPNSSFIGSQRGEQKSGLLHIPAREGMELHPSSDTDSLRSWVKKSPNYSRV